jgi:hypothetical protein
MIENVFAQLKHINDFRSRLFLMFPKFYINILAWGGGIMVEYSAHDPKI